MHSTKQLISPAVAPISLNEVKAQLHIETSYTAEDDYLNSLIAMATNHMESLLFRRLVYQKVRQYFDVWPVLPGNYFELLFGNLQSVSQVAWSDADESENVISSSEYGVVTVIEPGRVVLKNDESWPTGTLSTISPIYIDFFCGLYVGDDWAALTSYSTGDIITTVLNNSFICTTSGTSGASEPSWDYEIDATTTDGTAVWALKGIGIAASLKHALKLHIGHMFENREEVVVGQGFTSVKVQRSYDSLIAPWRLYN